MSSNALMCGGQGRVMLFTQSVASSNVGLTASLPDKVSS